jgi:DNA-binding XRE family transcriptional regulator
MTNIAFMSDEARAYYDGGKRAIIDGVPCRVAAWHGQRTGRASIAKLVAIGSPVEPGSIPEGPRFSFEPVEGARLSDGKPSARGNYSYRSRFGHKSRWWKPNAISLAPMYGMRYGRLTDETADEHAAKLAWSGGDAEPLRNWLLERAGERQATWAAIDACRAVAAFARALRALPVAVVPAVVEPVREPLPASPVDRVELAAFILSRCQRIDTDRLLDDADNMSRSELTADKFRKRREALGWTQEQMADWGGVNRRTIIRFEDGSQPVPRIWKLALDGLVLVK